MEQAILAMQGITLTMIGVIVTLMLYLDRGRRADIAQLRTDTNEGFKEARADRAQIRTEMHNGFAQLRQEMRDGDAKICQEMRGGDAKISGEMRDGDAKISDVTNDGFKHVHTRLDKLTDIVMDLCRRVGRLEGRAEVSEPETDTSQ
ncbi:hypothetical protein [Candidatus Poriferisocius sp.]|uniref:hypothetical protein n=1 Tax=Candidatus Poriferisocius sp. TaxID=3101276 RepID=UPI003B01A802